MGEVLKSIFIIIGTIIGAGFASGQEIAAFFNRYGNEGLCGLIFSCLLFSVVILYILLVTDKKNINTYEDLIGKNKFLKFVEEIFLLICFCIMIAGIGAFFEEQFDIYHWVGALIGCLICFLIFSYKYKGLEILNTVLVPFIIVGILFVSFGKYDLSALEKVKYKMQDNFTNNFLLSSVLYVGYNSLILIPILVKLKTYSFSKTQKYAVASGSLFVLCFVGVSLFKAINMFFPKIMAFELPTLKLASMMGETAKFIYGIIILFAIFTTAISSGFAFLEMDDKNYMTKNFVLCLIAFLVSNVGFSELVNTLFPIFGYVGIVEIIMICIYSLKRGRKETTNE